MERMNAYLRDLLILHDCVILPEFGGFVGNYKSAQKTDKGYFTPPRKIIAFNPQLKENDGLLANTIVGIEKVSYNEALQKITNFVDGIKKELKAKGAYTIPAVGKLEQKAEQRLLFTPDATSNLFTMPVGLQSFNMTPITKESAAPKKKEGKVAYFPIFRKVLVAGVSGFALLSLLFNQEAVQNIALSSIAPINEMKVQTEEEMPSSLISEKANSAEAEKAVVAKTEELAPESIMATTEKAAVAVSEVEQIKKYHIVVGCFSMKKNAEVQVEHLKEKFPNVRTYRHTYDLTGVSVGSFGTFQEAKSLLDQLRNSGDAPSAWILKRKILN